MNDFPLVAQNWIDLDLLDLPTLDETPSYLEWHKDLQELELGDETDTDDGQPIVMTLKTRLRKYKKGSLAQFSTTHFDPEDAIDVSLSRFGNVIVNDDWDIHVEDEDGTRFDLAWDEHEPSAYFLRKEYEASKREAKDRMIDNLLEEHHQFRDNWRQQMKTVSSFAQYNQLIDLAFRHDKRVNAAGSFTSRPVDTLEESSQIVERVYNRLQYERKTKEVKYQIHVESDRIKVRRGISRSPSALRSVTASS
jgi:hypothetical protein